MSLVVLKYLGLCIAAVSSIWATTHELTIGGLPGRKRLTRAGVVSIILTLTGLVIAIISQDLQHRGEVKRTNEIVISAQPLTSLCFTLRFESSNSELREQMKHAEKSILENAESSQRGVTNVALDTMEYEANLLPLLEFLGRLGDDEPEQAEAAVYDLEEESRPNGVVALIALDDSPNTILSFGDVGGSVRWSRERGLDKLSAGFAPADHDTRSGMSSPWTTNHLSDYGLSEYVIKWDLDPITLEHSIDRAIREIRATAKLPRLLKVAILRDFKLLPFAYNNFALTDAVNLWDQESRNGEHHAMSEVSNMTVAMQVNGFHQLIYHYRLTRAYPVQLQNDVEDDFEIRCTILEFQLKGGTAMWVVLATIAAGAVIGFVTGGARVSSAGHVTTGVSGFIAGALAAGPSNLDVDGYAKVFCLYIFSLFATYVAANILRHKKKLEWLYGERKNFEGQPSN